MGEVIYLSQSQAAAMTTFKELVKFYSKKDPSKYEQAIANNLARYQAGMDEVLGRN